MTELEEEGESMRTRERERGSARKERQGGKGRSEEGESERADALEQLAVKTMKSSESA